MVTEIVLTGGVAAASADGVVLWILNNKKPHQPTRPFL